MAIAAITMGIMERAENCPEINTYTIIQPRTLHNQLIIESRDIEL
jgi:hypothetical protein